MTVLSDRRIALLRAIADHQANGRFPLARELASEIGLAGESSLRKVLQPLVLDGYLLKQGGGAERQQCLYRLSEKGAALIPEGHGNVVLPVLGTIPAGPLAEAIQECEEFIEPGNSLLHRPGDFFLRVRGDSMIGDGILDGDAVLIRPGIQVSSGQIVAALVRHEDGLAESTLKRVRFEQGRKAVVLRASNPVYPDLVIASKSVEIAGVCKGLIRNF